MSAALLRRRTALLSIYWKCNGYANVTSPPPIQVRFTTSAGRGVFATRRISAGELIHTAKPILSHPSLSSLHSVCYFCLTNLQHQPSNLPFCSDECRQQSKIFYETEKQADWSGFHEYCRTQGLKYPLLVKRLACMIISGAASPETLDILQPAMLSSEMILLVILSKRWYIDVLARIRINSFRIELALGPYEDILLSAAATVEAEATVGNAIYMLPSFYNHDCDPNAHILWIESVRAKLKALRDIEAGEELRICYIDASMNRDARNAILSEGFGFHCKCARCMFND
ncbi:unnamed protein product [Withania somnifera]